MATIEYIPPNELTASCQVAGSFNNWKPQNMIREGKIFKFVLPHKESAKFSYKLVIDGNWTTDPTKETVKDNEGNVNNVIEVFASEKTTFGDPINMEAVDENMKKSEEEEEKRKKKAEEEEMRKKAEEEKRRKAEEEEIRKKTEEEEMRRKAEEEEVRKKTEEEEKRKKAEEEEVRKKTEEEEMRKKEAEEERKKAEEEEMRKKAEEEEERKKTEEEEERKKAEEEMRKKAEEEETRKKEEEEEMRRKAEEEERRRNEEEMKRKAVEEMRRKEEEMRRKEAEEEMRRKAEEEKRRKAEEEKTRKKEEEKRRKAEEEKRKKAEEEMRKKAEEEMRRKAEEEEEEEEEEMRKKAEEQEMRRIIEEEEMKRKEEEERRKHADEEKTRKKAEEERRKKSAEEEMRRKADEERRRKADEERRRKADEEIKRKSVGIKGINDRKSKSIKRDIEKKEGEWAMNESFISEAEEFSKSDSSFNVNFYGDSSVGKTSLFNRYLFSSFDNYMNSTIGVDFKQKEYTLVDGQQLHVKYGDTAGQERFRSITATYFKQTNLAIVVSSYEDFRSAKSLNYWIEMLQSHNVQKVIVVCNKCDTSFNEEVDQNDAIKLSREIAEENEFPFVCVSAKTSYHLEILQDLIIHSLHVVKSDDEDTVVTLEKQQKQKKGTCAC